MPNELSKRFRITGRDKNGDIQAFETDNRERAREMLEVFKRRFQDVEQETQRWI